MNKNVWLVGDHHNLPEAEELSAQKDIDHFLKYRKDTTLLTEDLLDFPLMKHSDLIIKDQRWINHHFSALRALASLKGFISFVSLGIKSSEEGEAITIPKREWGEIYLASTGKRVLCFSHDTRKKNYLFYSLLEWVEEDISMESVEKWSTEEIWRKFFLTRLRNEVDRLNEEASNLHHEARSLKDRADRCQHCLPHPQ